MSRKRRGSANTNRRQRAVPPADTLEGKQIAQDLETILLDCKVRLPDLARDLFPSPVKTLAWTVRLPDYERARDSAVVAFLRVLRRSGLFREWAAAGSRASLSSIAYQALGHGLGREDDLLRCLSLVPTEDNLERERRKVAALRSRQNPIQQRFGLDLTVPSCGYNLSSVVIGDLQNSFEFWLPTLWTSVGLWLAANAEVATAVLSYISGWDNSLRGLRVPKPNTYAKWLRDLRLHSHRGSGRLLFSKKYDPQADAALRREAGLDKDAS